MKLKITVYKSSGKYYTDAEVSSNKDIPLHEDEFKRFIMDNLPAHCSGGYVTVEDLSDNQSFHQCLLFIN